MPMRGFLSVTAHRDRHRYAGHNNARGELNTKGKNIIEANAVELKNKMLTGIENHGDININRHSIAVYPYHLPLSQTETSVFAAFAKNINAAIVDTSFLPKAI
jgi:hypothetical protein